MVINNSKLVRSVICMCGKPVSGQRGSDRAHGGTKGFLASLNRFASEARCHRTAILRPNFFCENFRLVARQLCQRATKQREHKIIATNRKLGHNIINCDVALRRPTGDT
jgi:hypothetical protein